ncbi:MAG: acyl transferase [Bacteroidota bacterium]
MIFSIKSKSVFNKIAIELFCLQAKKNSVYKKYIRQININPEKVKSIIEIPFLPIEFFKSHKITTNPKLFTKLFLSSGTTGTERSKHYVADISLYEKSFRKCFELFYGDIKQYTILAILPSYYKNKNSSLLYMINDLIYRSKKKESGFYLDSDNKKLVDIIQKILSENKKVILFGVPSALLKMSASFTNSLTNSLGQKFIVMETGGMKSRSEEIIREELHKTLCEKFGVNKIHSEYGMTELFSQSYSQGDGLFYCPPWMKIFVRDVNDPFQILPYGKTGAINIIDLANIHSCSFIATQDLGKIYENGSFEVHGRMDNSDLRGCNLMIE